MRLAHHRSLHRLFRMPIRTLMATVLLAGGLLSAGVATQAAQDDPRLDNLFKQLHETTDPAEARLLESYIWALWQDGNDESRNYLMDGGKRSMQVGDLYEAISTFSRLIDLAPDFAEAWNKRATAYYMVGDYDESIEDCLKVIELEPRHFGALSGLGLIYTAREEPDLALYWFREALKQNPHMISIRERVEDLTREVEGEAI